MRYRLTLQYDGTEFHGWQLQPDRRTVQGVLEDSIFRMVGERVRVAASGRTDAGVHAHGQVVTFVLEREWPAERLFRGLNAVTPDDIGIRDVAVAPDDFDPRRSASSRVYVYRIWNARWESPFWRRHAWLVPRRVDIDAMNRAAAALVGEHDFTSFRAATCDAEGPVRRVLVSRFERDEELLLYRVEATAFLRHMVRNIIGTLVEVGEGKRTAESVAALLSARDRTKAAATAPPHGLTLEQVKYEGR